MFWFFLFPSVLKHSIINVKLILRELEVRYGEIVGGLNAVNWSEFALEGNVSMLQSLRALYHAYVAPPSNAPLARLDMII